MLVIWWIYCIFLLNVHDTVMSFVLDDRELQKATCFLNTGSGSLFDDIRVDSRLVVNVLCFLPPDCVGTSRNDNMIAMIYSTQHANSISPFSSTTRRNNQHSHQTPLSPPTSGKYAFLNISSAFFTSSSSAQNPVDGQNPTGIQGNGRSQTNSPASSGPAGIPGGCRRL